MSAACGSLDWCARLFVNCPFKLNRRERERTLFLYIRKFSSRAAFDYILETSLVKGEVRRNGGKKRGGRGTLSAGVVVNPISARL